MELLCQLVAGRSNPHTAQLAEHSWQRSDQLHKVQGMRCFMASPKKER